MHRFGNIKEKHQVDRWPFHWLMAGSLLHDFSPQFLLLGIIDEELMKGLTTRHHGEYRNLLL